MPVAIEVPEVAKKSSKPAETPKRYGSLVRVSDDFADAINKAAAIRQQSVREYADEVLMAIVQKSYKDDILAAARRIEKESGK